VDWDQRWPWQLQRMVSRSLTLQHERVIYMLGDSPANRQLIHRHIDVWEFPDGRIEIRAEGQVIKHERYDRLPVIDAGAVVENKRLGSVCDHIPSCSGSTEAAPRYSGRMF
jgi:hypothetical protein